MISLLNETGQFYLDNQTSKYVTFAFKGDSEFLERTQNMLLNCGAVKNTNKINEEFHYCYIPIERLKRALFLNFRAQIVQEREPLINYITKQIKDEVDDIVGIEVEWDEAKLEELSNNKVEEFFSTKITIEDLKLYSDSKPFIGEYSVGYYQDGEPEKITE